MAVAAVQSAYNSALTTSAATASFGSSTTSGNTVLVSVAGYSAIFTAGNVTDNKGNTYELVRAVLQGAACSVAIYRCFNASGGASHTVTVTNTGIASKAIGVVEVSGLGSSPYYDRNAADTTDTTSPFNLCNTGTLDNADEIAIGACAVDQGTLETWGTPSGWTEIGEVNNGVATLVNHHAYIVVAATTALNPSWTLTGSTLTSASIVATFKPTIAAPATDGAIQVVFL